MKDIIKDKMIEDFREIFDNWEVSNDYIKRELKQKDYEVEEKETALEEFYKYLDNMAFNFKDSGDLPDIFDRVIRNKVVKLCEELQQKPIIDDKIIFRIKNIISCKSDSYSKEDIEYFEKLLKQLGVEL